MWPWPSREGDTDAPSSGKPNVASPNLTLHSERYHRQVPAEEILAKWHAEFGPFHMFIGHSAGGYAAQYFGLTYKTVLRLAYNAPHARHKPTQYQFSIGLSGCWIEMIGVGGKRVMVKPRLESKPLHSDLFYVSVTDGR